MILRPFILYVLAGILFYNPTFLLSISKIICVNMSSVILRLFKDFYPDCFDALIWSGLNMGCGVEAGWRLLSGIRTASFQAGLLYLSRS